MSITVSGITKMLNLSLLFNKVTEIMSLTFADDDKPIPKVSTRKPSDTTKLTQYMYDFIIKAHGEFIEYNKAHPKNKKTTVDLARVLNERMGLHKSVTTYSHVWCGKVDRDSLATGKQYFHN